MIRVIPLSFNYIDEMLLLQVMAHKNGDPFTPSSRDFYERAFTGGIGQLMKYLSENIKYPKEALGKSIQGRVYINFIVEPDGHVSNVKVIRGIGGGCDEEAVRVVKAMPKWKPGKQRGKAVPVYYNLPINFKL